MFFTIPSTTREASSVDAILNSFAVRRILTRNKNILHFRVVLVHTTMCAPPTRGVRDRALREHGESPGPFHFPLPLFPGTKGSGQGYPLLPTTFSPTPPRARRDALLSRTSTF